MQWLRAEDFADVSQEKKKSNAMILWKVADAGKWQPSQLENSCLRLFVSQCSNEFLKNVNLLIVLQSIPPEELLQITSCPFYWPLKSYSITICYRQQQFLVYDILQVNHICEFLSVLCCNILSHHKIPKCQSVVGHVTLASVKTIPRHAVMTRTIPLPFSTTE